MKKLLLAVLVAASMSACGDGASTPATEQSAVEEVTTVAEALREDIIVQHLEVMAQKEQHRAERVVLRLYSDGGVNLVVSDYTEKDIESRTEDNPLGTAYGLHIRSLNDVQNLARTIRGMNENGRDGKITVTPSENVGAYVFNEYSNQSIEAECSDDLEVIRVAAQGYMVVTTSCHDLRSVADGIIFPSKHASAIAAMLDNMIAEVSG